MNWITKFIKPKIKSLFKKKSADSKDGLWTNCSCSKLILKEEFKNNLYVCPSCDKPHLISSKQRFAIFFDDSEYQTLDYAMPEENPLNFVDTKKYSDRLKEARQKTGEKEAMLAATGWLNAHPITVVNMNFKVLGGSVSPAVGECFLSAAQHSIEKNQPLILFTTSGGMRMQTGILSLQQMSRMSLAAIELKKNNIPFITIAAGHVLGGTTASFASLSDFIFSEHKDYLWGFSGKRIIEQNLREKLPDEVQTSSWTLEHGGIDKIIHRSKIRDEVYNILSILLKLKEKENINKENEIAVDKDLSKTLQKQAV